MNRVFGNIVLAIILLLQAHAVAAGPTTRVACVGDSITFGATLRDRQHHAYPARLGRWLGAGWEVKNFGVSSATVLKRGYKPYLREKAFAQAIEFKPDVVVIKLGTNDTKHRDDAIPESEKALNNWQYKADFLGDYKDLIEAFRKENPAVKVYACLPVPSFPGRWGINDKTLREEVIPLIRHAASESGASVIDLHAALNDKAELFPDRIHPNDAGAKLIAATVYKTLIGSDPPPEAEPPASTQPEP